MALGNVSFFDVLRMPGAQLFPNDNANGIVDKIEILFLRCPLPILQFHVGHCAVLNASVLIELSDVLQHVAMMIYVYGCTNDLCMPEFIDRNVQQKKIFKKKVSLQTHRNINFVFVCVLSFVNYLKR